MAVSPIRFASVDAVLQHVAQQESARRSRMPLVRLQAAALGVREDVYRCYLETLRPWGVVPPFSDRKCKRVRKPRPRFHRVYWW